MTRLVKCYNLRFKQASKYVFEEITCIRSQVPAIFIENSEVVLGALPPQPSSVSYGSLVRAVSQEKLAENGVTKGAPGGTDPLLKYQSSAQMRTFVPSIGGDLEFLLLVVFRSYSTCSLSL
jgi:hypothetical protein